jgi:hypothetical protein
MTESGRIEEFFEELGRRGHDPLLARLCATGRFEVSGDGRTDHWFVSVKGGFVTVSRGGGGDVDWIMRAEREALNGIIDSDSGVLAALIRGTLSVTGTGPSVPLGLLNRLFAGAPEFRKQ